MCGVDGLTSTDADTLFRITSDVLTRFQLSMDDCRGQCFDGASNMSGHISGLQKRILDVQRKALFVHCVGHCSNLAFQDAVAVVPECRDAMNLVKELINFIRESPKRLSWFTNFKDTGSPALRPLCPTRWTMRVSSVQSILDNYSELLPFLQDMSDTEKGEIGAKSNGFLKQLSTFSTFFSIKLLDIVFSKLESLARCLQSPKLSLTQAQSMVAVCMSALTSARDDNSFNDIWKKTCEDALTIGVQEPVVPRRRRPPRRLDNGSEGYQDETCEDLYRRVYFSSVDAVMSCLDNRFQSPAFGVARDIEVAIVEAVNGNTPCMKAVIEHFGSDLDHRRLELHLAMFCDVLRAGRSMELSPSVTCMNDVVNMLMEKTEWRKLFPELVKLLQLFLTIPVTTCTAERTFSSLRRLKTYLRSTLTQKRLNHVAVLHCHRDRCEQLNLKKICNAFVERNSMRQSTVHLLCLSDFVYYTELITFNTYKYRRCKLDSC